MPDRSPPLPWIKVADGAPYFVTEAGEAWTPIGHNDGICWLDLAGLFRRRDMASVEAYLDGLAQSGVTCLRLMLEDARHRHRYFEKPVGRFVPAMVALWDDLIALCERVGLRLILTPVDTFWTWLHWRHHPYNRANGGVLDRPNRWLLDEGAREALKHRLSFAVRRWGGSGVLFAWDLWNEIHPAQGLDSVEGFGPFIADLSRHVRALETALYGRSHPQTVSVFGPELSWKPHLDIAGPIFRHPDLDFASIHVYEEGTIDHPSDTVAPALATGAIVGRSLAEIRDERPFLDTEHGPIHNFNNRHVTLPVAFDDEYFRHMQWAHLASGGVGGGMRWPYRHPHRLTPGMRDAQRAMAAFLPLIDWPRFKRRPLAIEGAPRGLACFGCGDGRQALLWCLRGDALDAAGRVRRDVPPIEVVLHVPGFEPGSYAITGWDTLKGIAVAREEAVVGPGGSLVLPLPPFAADLAVAVTRTTP